jgi:drug/metabolite transporter (DMT)-like permease
MNRLHFSPPVAAALAAALLFGASTPFAKQLLRDLSPVLLAGLLYLGSGIGLGLIRLARDRGWRKPVMPAREWLWLLLATGFGGVLAPLALMLGLMTTPAATASLLLNLEAVLTAVIAWVVFRETPTVTSFSACWRSSPALCCWRGPMRRQPPAVWVRARS